MVDHGQYEKLIKVQPKLIKSELCGFDITNNLIVVDKSWNGRPIDLQVGDYLLVEGDSGIQDNFVKIELIKENLWVAKNPGITRLAMQSPEKYFIIRVRRKEYVGRAKFRNLEEE